MDTGAKIALGVLGALVLFGGVFAATRKRKRKPSMLHFAPPVPISMEDAYAPLAEAPAAQAMPAQQLAAPVAEDERARWLREEARKDAESDAAVQARLSRMRAAAAPLEAIAQRNKDRLRQAEAQLAQIHSAAERLADDALEEEIRADVANWAYQGPGVPRPVVDMEREKAKRRSRFPRRVIDVKVERKS